MGRPSGDSGAVGRSRRHPGFFGAAPRPARRARRRGARRPGPGALAGRAAFFGARRGSAGGCAAGPVRADRCAVGAPQWRRRGADCGRWQTGPTISHRGCGRPRAAAANPGPPSGATGPPYGRACHGDPGHAAEGSGIAPAVEQENQTIGPSSGTGSIPRLALVPLELAAGVELAHIPYDGMAPVLNDLLGARVAGVFADVPAVLAHVRTGRLKALGIAAAKRHLALPEARTFQEQGFANVDTNNWHAMFVSAKTPADIVQQLSQAVRRAVADPTANAKIVQSGAEPRSSSPEELAAIVRDDTAKWAQLIRSRNIEVEG